MAMRLRVHLLPSSVRPSELTGAVAVVIDVLRATTTITTALAHGAEAVVPCLDIEAAHERAAHLRAGDGCVLLGGERGGRLIPGFDLGNSPAEYSAERVAGRTIVFTTTNGTRAIEACRAAERVLLAALNNRMAAAAALRGAELVHLVCAGADGQITREDALAAGALVDPLTADDCNLDDEALLALAAWREVQRRCGQPPGQAELAHELADSYGGRNLLALGLESDLLAAAALDRNGLVPELDAVSGEIRAQVPRADGR